MKLPCPRGWIFLLPPFKSDKFPVFVLHLDGSIIDCDDEEDDINSRYSKVFNIIDEGMDGHGFNPVAKQALAEIAYGLSYAPEGDWMMKHHFGGSAGTGKSALVRVFAEMMTETGGAFMDGDNYERGEGVAFYPLDCNVARALQDFFKFNKTNFKEGVSQSGNIFAVHEACQGGIAIIQFEVSDALQACIE